MSTVLPRRERAGGWWVIVVWAVAFVGARLALELLPADSAWRVPVALLPTPLFIAVLWMVRRGVRQMDELERRIHLEALAIAFPLTVMLLMLLGLLEIATALSPADWSYRHIWPFALLFYMGGYVIARRRYE